LEASLRTPFLTCRIIRRLEDTELLEEEQ
jgi:hypothetical protein